MTCRDVLDRVEAIAAGDEAATPELRAHLEGCLMCAAALAEARRIEAALATRPAPAAPPRFAAAVASRIRQQRWQSEQHVDRMFNVALIAGVLAIAAGVVAFFNVNTLAGAFTASVGVLNRVAEEVFVQAAPAFSTYVAAGGFLATALFVWWWAERRLSL